MMDFRSILTEFPSRFEKELYINQAANSGESFRSLLNLALYEEDPLAWRAAWILDGCAELFPEMALPHIPTIVRRLPDLKSKGTLRSLLRMLCRYEIPEDEQGLMIDLCFGYLVSELFPVAVKVHAMQIIYQHVLLYPELKKELVTVIEDQMVHNTVGFKSRGKRLIRKMNAL